jgi:general secretion pathway protein D
MDFSDDCLDETEFSPRRRRVALNRLATIRRHQTLATRTLGIVAAIWMLSASDLSAQSTAPQSSPATVPQATSSTVPIDNARKLVSEARAALAGKDLAAAADRYRRAASIAPKVPEIVPDVARLRLDLQIAGVDSAMLKPGSAKAPVAIGSLPSLANAKPIVNPVPTDPAARKREALRLVAVGRAALDRGDANSALRHARDAQKLKVPEGDFQPGEPRVWQFVLDAESAARRQGISTASPIGGSANLGAVRQASNVASGDEAGAIAQMLFQPEANAGSNIKQVQAEDVYAAPLGEAGNNPGVYGQRLFEAGMEALRSGDRATARTRFTQAWQYESQLDLSVRRQLQDKLTLLQTPSKLPATGSAQAAEMTPIQRADLKAAEETRRLYREVSSELASIGEKKTETPLEALDQLNRLHRKVDGANVSEASRRGMMAMVDRSLAEQTSYVEAHRAEIELELRNDAIHMEMAAEHELDAQIDEEVMSLVETYNDLMREKRFSEAEVVAKKVGELKPGSPIANALFTGSRFASRRMIQEQISDEKENSNVQVWMDLERSAVQMNPDDPYQLPEARTWEDLSTRRLADRNEDSRLSSAERDIQRKMEDRVKVNYKERPLGEVLDDLNQMTGIPIVMDNRALAQIRVTPTDPVSLSVPNGVPLRSALNLMLRDLDLTYVIENDVLNITSFEAKRSKVYPVTYRVTDLVTPIPNFTSSYEDGLAGALRSAYQMSNPQTDVQLMPVSSMELAQGSANSMQPSKMAPTMLGQYAGMGSQGGFGSGGSSMGGRSGGGSFADFQSLISLIETTVVPDTWESLGGPSTMAEYPQNLSLVISTTSDVHDQIADLLESLRRLQNLQITIEVRFITLSDTFFEQIGVDFNVQFDDNTRRLPDDDSGAAVTVGIGQDGLPTADLDIRFENGNFPLRPAFGAPDAGSISTLGFAILSDIEAFFFLEAAQGDTRNNVMQAPKVTLFDGQIATISDVTQRPFVTSITPVVGDFAVAQQPVIVVLNEGTQLNVQGIVSDDKRFVRLTLVPFFSQIGDVNTFTFEGRRSTRRNSRTENGDTNGDGVVNDDDAANTEDEEDVIEGTTVQLPTFAFTQVSTTVSVPDGGTILLGGIKRLAEGRTERGVPMLGKIPYVSRLFRNVAVGREARSLMLMVTPRIIIQEEEEIAQTGFDPNR